MLVSPRASSITQKCLHILLFPLFGVILLLMDIAIASYSAGLIDSDGSIFISRRAPGNHRNISTTFNLIISFANTNVAPVKFLQLHFGGSVLSYTPKSILGRQATWIMRRKIYHWTLYNNEAEICLQNIYPYLITKKRQALIGLALRATFRFQYKAGTIIPIPLRNMRTELWQMMRNLNIKNGKGHHRPQKLSLLRTSTV